MDISDNAQLLYLCVLLGALIFYFVISNRQHMGRAARHAILWALIFMAVLAGVGLWESVRATLAPAQIVRGVGEISIDRGINGHYNAQALVNGVPLKLLVDTGATSIVLSEQDARAIGIDIDSLVYTGRANTANGQVRTAPVRIQTLELGGVLDTNLRAYVSEGELFGSLLGMNYLSRYQSIQIEGGKLLLKR